MIPILIPIGKYHFFVDICVKNIMETTDGQAEIIFLTTKTIPAALENALNRADVRHLRCDMDFNDNKYIHLKLLDWAFYHGGLPEVVCIQHADVIWIQNGWHKQIERFCKKSECLAYTIPYKSSAKSDFKHLEYK